VTLSDLAKYSMTRFQLITVITIIPITIIVLGLQYFRIYFFSLLFHNINSNLTVAVSSFIILSSTYSTILIDCLCSYCSLGVVSYSAIFVASMSLKVQFSSRD